MKIIHICPLYHPSVGGNQIHFKLLSESLVKCGHEVHVFTSNALVHHYPLTALLPSVEEIHGVKVHRFKSNKWLQDFICNKLIKIRGGYRLFRILFGESLGFWQQGPVTLLMLVKIALLKPDIVVAVNNVFFATHIGFLVKRYFKIPVVIMPILHVGDKYIKAEHRLEALKNVDRIIACTTFEKNLLIDMGIPSSQIDIIPIGIPIIPFLENKTAALREKYKIPPDVVTIAFVGRKVPEKGIESLIDAMAFVWEEIPQVCLLLAGQRTDAFSKVIDRHISQHDSINQAKIIQIDDFSDDEKTEIYEVLDILAMPSIADAFGLVYLEAWMRAKPVIACRATPQEDIIQDSVNGILVDYLDVKQLANALIVLCCNKNKREHMGRSGRASLEKNFNQETYTKQIAACYQKQVATC